jgi:hypothetical protein
LKNLEKEKLFTFSDVVGWNLGNGSLEVLSSPRQLSANVNFFFRDVEMKNGWPYL